MAISLGIYPIFRQTHIYLSIYLSTMCVIGNEWNEWTISIGNASRGVQHLPRDGPRLSRSDQIWKISNIGIIGPSSERFLVADLILLCFLYCIIRYIYIYVPSLHREEFSLQFPELWHLLAQLADKTIQHNAKHRFLIPEVRKLNSQKQPSMDIYGLAPWSPHFLLWTLTPRAPRWSMIIFKLILISFFGIIESDKVIELSDEQLIW